MQLERQYLQRTVPKVGTLMGPIEEALKEKFFPMLFGGEEINADFRQILGHSVKHCGSAESAYNTYKADIRELVGYLLGGSVRERKETSAQMKQITALLLAATTNKSPKTPLSSTTQPKTDGVSNNPSATPRVRHLPLKNIQTPGLLRGKPIRTCASCTKNWVTHTDKECYEIEANAAKRRLGWISYFL